MTIAEVYRKYKHMDKVLSTLSKDYFPNVILKELWQAIKEEVKKEA